MLSIAEYKPTSAKSTCTKMNLPVLSPGETYQGCNEDIHTVPCFFFYMYVCLSDQIPYKVFQKHSASLVKLISDPAMLAFDLWSAELVSSSVKEDVLTSRGLSFIYQSSLLLNDFSKSLLIPKEDQVTLLKKFCKVLHNQDSPGLSRIADQLLHEIKLE